MLVVVVVAVVAVVAVVVHCHCCWHADRRYVTPEVFGNNRKHTQFTVKIIHWAKQNSSCSAFHHLPVTSAVPPSLPLSHPVHSLCLTCFLWVPCGNLPLASWTAAAPCRFILSTFVVARTQQVTIKRSEKQQQQKKLQIYLARANDGKRNFHGQRNSNDNLDNGQAVWPEMT